MAWTTPKTWTVGEVVTAANMNTHVRDNLLALYPSLCRVAHSAAQTTTTGVGLTLAFDTERYDTDAYHSTVTNNSRLTVPSGLGGKFMVYGQVAFDGITTGLRHLSILLNATTTIGAANAINAGANVLRMQVATPGPHALVATDYVQLIALQDSGGNIDLLIGGATLTSEFGIVRVAD